MNPLILTNVLMPLDVSAITPSIGEMQRTYLFKLIIESYPISLNAEFAQAKVISENIDLWNQQGFWPERKTADIDFRWAGERIWFSGYDDSPKTFELTFACDEKMRLLDFFEACKDLTGNLINHAAQQKPLQTLTLGIYMVNTLKNEVTDYRRGIDCRISGVKLSSTIDKKSNELAMLSINGTYDNIAKDTSKRGKTI